MGYFPSPWKTFSEIFIPTQTAWTDAAKPSVNHGNETVMRNGGNNTTSNRNALLKFNVSAIGFGALVQRAELRLYCSGETASKGGRYSVRGLASDWTETGVTHLSTGYEAWAGGNINALGNYDGASASELINGAPVDGSGAPNPYYKPGAWPVGDDWFNQWIEFDVTGLVQNWVSGARENNGLVITCISKVPDPDNLIDEYYGYMDVRWHTRHNANAPQLLVAYIPGSLKPHAALHQSGGADEISVEGLSGVLADPQVPAAHGGVHELGGADEIGVAGLSGVLADPQVPAAHGGVHELGGADEISVAGLSGVLADLQVPVVHGGGHESGGADEINVAGLSGVLADPQVPAVHGSDHESSGGDEIDVTGLAGLLANAQKVQVLENALFISERAKLNFRDAFNIADDGPNERANISLAVKPHYAAQLGAVYNGAVAIAIDLSANGWIDMKGVRLPNSGSPIAKVEVATAGGLLPPYGQKYGTVRMRFAFYPETTPAGFETVRFWISAEARGLSLISIFSTSWVRYNFYLDKNIGI